MSLEDLASLLDQDEETLASLAIPDFDSSSTALSGASDVTKSATDEHSSPNSCDVAASLQKSEGSGARLQHVAADLVLSDEDGDSAAPSDPADSTQNEIDALEARIRKLKKDKENKGAAAVKRDLSTVVGKIQKPPSPNKTQILEDLPPALAVIVKSDNKVSGEGERLGHRLRSLLGRSEQSSVHRGDTDSSDDEDNRDPFESKYNEFGRAIKRISSQSTTLAVSRDQLQEKAELINRATRNQLSSCSVKKRSSLSKSTADKKLPPADDFVLLDTFNRMNIMSPRLSHADVRECMRDKQLILVSCLERQIRTEGDGSSIPGNWVTIGVIARKSDPRTSQKGSSYSSWTLTDLVECQKPACLMLFGEANSSLWKTTVGTVVAVAGAKIMKDRDLDKGSSVVMSVNSSQHCILLGTSADLGFCQSKCKNGRVCLTFVNKRLCPVCVYHMSAEYKKSASNRGELQGCSGVTPRQRSIGGVGTISGVKGGVNSGGGGGGNRLGFRQANAPSSADKERLASLGYQKASSAALNNRSRNLVIEGKHLSAEDVKTISGVVSNKNAAVGELLMTPCAGARNMLKYMNHESTTASQVTSSQRQLTASGRQLLNAEICRERALQSTPRLSADNRAGEYVDLTDTSPSVRSSPIVSINKRRAVELLRRSGGLKRADPNQVPASRRNQRTGVSDASIEAIRQRVEADVSRRVGSDSASSKQTSDNRTAGKRSLAADSANDSERETKLARIRAAITAKSSHAATLEAQMSEREEVYFDTLEKKEMIENKMLDTWQIKTKAVYCPKCKYKALGVSELCKAEKHACVTVDAMKRFFACKNCTNRTVSLERWPMSPCSNCGQDAWKRAPMARERTGPKLENEVLSIRGNECKFVNSFTKNRNINLEC